MLHYAFEHGKTEEAKNLMFAGANLLSWDTEGMNPLHVAVLGKGKKVGI